MAEAMACHATRRGPGVAGDLAQHFSGVSYHEKNWLNILYADVRSARQ